MSSATPSVQDLKARFGLVPHPTCGFVSETYRAQRRFVPDGYGADRPLGSVLMFMATPDATLQLHRIRPDQMYHHYLGDPLEVLLFLADGTWEVRTIGSVAAGHEPYLFIPGQTFHVFKLAGGEHGFSLLATTEWPGVE